MWVLVFVIGRVEWGGGRQTDRLVGIVGEIKNIVWTYNIMTKQIGRIQKEQM